MILQFIKEFLYKNIATTILMIATILIIVPFLIFEEIFSGLSKFCRSFTENIVEIASGLSKIMGLQHPDKEKEAFEKEMRERCLRCENMECGEE